MKIIQVEVHDPYLISKIMRIEEVKKIEIATIKSVGFLIHEDDEKLILCQSIYPEEDEKDIGYSEPFILPKCSIKKITKLKETK